MKYKNDFLNMRWNLFDAALHNTLNKSNDFNEQCVALLAVHDIIQYDFYGKGLAKLVTFKEYCDILTDGFGDIIVTLNATNFKLYAHKFEGIQERMESFKVPS